MTLLVQEKKLIWAGEPKNYTGAAMTAEYVSMKGYDHLTILIQTGAWAAGTAAVTLLQSTDTTNSLADAAAIAFTSMWSDEVAGGTLVENTVTTNTFNLDTANKLYVIELDAAQLNVDSGFDCVTLAVASPGGNADFYGVLYILGEPRYASATPLAAITD